MLKTFKVILRTIADLWRYYLHWSESPCEVLSKAIVVDMLRESG